MCCVLAMCCCVLTLVPAGATPAARGALADDRALVEDKPEVPKAEWQPFIGERVVPANPSAPAETPHSAAPRLVEIPRLAATATAATAASAAAAATSAAPLPAPLLVQQALPNCSVVFFHHLEKTAGTTLRSVLQREAQLGLFDFFSFVNRYNKVQFQSVTARLDQLLSTPGGLRDLRLAVEIHIGGGGYEQFLWVGLGVVFVS